MNEVNLLIITFLDQSGDQGLQALINIISRANLVELRVFSKGQTERWDGLDAIARLSKPFNVVECSLEINDIGQLTKQRLDIRYRPGVASRAWAHVELPADPDLLLEAASRVHGKDNAENFRRWLSLQSFENASRKQHSSAHAVVEMLHRSLPSTASIEQTVVQTFEKYYPELLKIRIWGYVNSVPFRGLSLDEEWQVAAASLLWVDVSASSGGEFQYMFMTPGAHPKVRVPEHVVRNADLTVFRL